MESPLVWLLAVGLGLAAWFLIRQPIWLELCAIGGRLTLTLRWLGLTASYDARARSKTVSWLRWRFWSSSGKSVARDKAVQRKGRRSEMGLLLHHRGLIWEIAYGGWQALKDFLRRLRWERCLVRVSIGTSDPAMTGILFGYATAARSLLLGRFPQAELELQPDFESGRTRAEAEALLGVRPLDVIVVTVRLLHRLPKRKVFELIREIRQKRKIRGGNSYGTAGSA